MNSETSDNDSQPAGPTLRALQAVAERCAAGDADGAVQQLVASGYPLSVVHRLHGSYSAVPRDIVEQAVADGVAAVHRAVREGRPVPRPGGYLLKVADAACAAEQRLQERQRSVDALTDRAILDARTPWHDLESGEVRDRRRTAAVALARELLPHLGQQVAQSVMAFAFDAVERGDVHVPSRVIADELGLSDDVVRASLSRGFKRLARLAAQRGLDVRAEDLLDDPDFDLAMEEDT